MWYPPKKNRPVIDYVSNIDVTKRHTRIYLHYFGYDESDFIPCELCGSRATDIHHIDARGMGGDPRGDKDRIENLMALCRVHHGIYGDKKQWVDFLIQRHLKIMRGNTSHWNYQGKR